MTYTIELNQKQVEILSYVSDKFARVIIGQIDHGIEDELQQALLKHRFNNERTDEYHNACEKLKETLDFLHTFCFNQPINQTYGIRYSEMSDMLFDINSVLRHQLFLDKGGKPRGATVDSYPAHRNSQEPLIKIERNEK